MTPRKPPPPPPPAPPPSNREKMKNAVDALMSQVKEQKAQTRAEVIAEKERKKRQRRMRYGQAAMVFLVFIASVVFSMPRWRQPFDSPSGEAAVHDARRALVFAATLVDHYQIRSGRLPGSFSQIGVTIPGLVYQKVGEGYALSMNVDGRDVIFRKGDNPQQFMNGH